MEITFLGTSSMVPTKERNHNAILVTHKTHGVLVDCGEGTQRQIKIAGIKPAKIDMILITHWHGDHVLGLPGLIQTLSTSDYTGTMRLYGPRGSKAHFEHLKKAFVFEERFDLEVHEVHSGVFYEDDEIVLEAAPMAHSVECVAFSIREPDRRRFSKEKLREHALTHGPHMKQLEQGETITWKGKRVRADDVSKMETGKKVTIIMDTKPTHNAVSLGRGSDVFICEATFTKDLADHAKRYKHMTAHDAAQLAKDAGAKRLILTHFSQRYKDVSHVRKEAQEVFDEVVCAQDFMRVEV